MLLYVSQVGCHQWYPRGAVSLSGHLQHGDIAHHVHWHDATHRCSGAAACVQVMSLCCCESRHLASHVLQLPSVSNGHTEGKAGCNQHQHWTAVQFTKPASGLAYVAWADLA